MSRSLVRFAILGAALAAAAIPMPLLAQTPSTPELIQSLEPRNATRAVPTPSDEAAAGSGNDVRGVRRAGEAGGAAEPTSTGSSTGSSTGTAPRATTAPDDVPAASITVQFATGSATISSAAGRALAPLGHALTSPQLSRYRFRIEGHTDTIGNDLMNRDLSQRRAEAVRDYLVRAFRVPGERLEAIGLGESQLLIPTPDNVPEARNRRVQILNLGS